MTKRAGAALLLATAALFLIANRAAYRSYFSDDELNNIRWTRELDTIDYVKGLLTPRFFTNNFRPTGHYYFREMSLWFGLDFPKYLPILHLAHILNVWLLWMLARRLGLSPMAASLGAFFFAFHMALFDVFWKPMYVFDLLCATFSLAAILLYTQRRYALSFCAFWLAYKSKELAVMLPAVLACYEFWLADKKNRKALVPFFALSLWFGLQGLLHNPSEETEYTFHFTAEAFRTCVSYYASRIFFVPYAGLALLALPLLVRDRRLWLGCAMLFLFFFPLLFLPGRLFSAYCYLPLTGAALVIAALASSSRTMTTAVTLLCALWIPWDALELRRSQREARPIGADNRTYVSTLADFARKSPDTRVFVYEGAPAALHPLGIRESLRLLYHRESEVYAFDDPQAAPALRRRDVALLLWNPADRKLAVSSSRTPVAYLTLDGRMLPWPLGEGWYSQEGGFRWMAPHATATLTRPAGAQRFELAAFVSSDQLKRTGPITVAVKINGVPAGTRPVTAEGQQTLAWQTAVDGQANIEIDVTPAIEPSNGDTRRLGLAVLGLGFR